MSYYYLKSLHLIFIVTWFAGLFYIVRLFIYHVEAECRPTEEKNILQEQFSIMQRRLWYGITWPSCVLAITFGLSLLHNFFPLTNHPWMLTKLGFVFLLFLYHLYCGHIYHQLKKGQTPLSSTQLRLYNEGATLFLVAIIFLVVLKSLLSMAYGLIGLILLTGILMLAIRIYRKTRAD